MQMKHKAVRPIIALLAILTLALPISSESAVFWTEDFENHLSPNWNTSYCGTSPEDGCNPAISTDVAHSGTHALRGTYHRACSQSSDPNVGTPNQTIFGCGVGLSRTHPASTTVWTRFWYYTVGFTYDRIGTKHFYHRDEINSTYPIPYLANLFGSRSLAMVDQVEASCKYDTCNYYASGPALADNQWYCIETLDQLNTPGQSNGMLQIYVNGVRVLNQTGLQQVGPNISNPNLNGSLTAFNTLILYVQDGDGLMYYDDFAVGDTQIGCGPISGKTPPPAPTGLRVY